VDDSGAPKQAMHFHGNNNSLHHGGKCFLSFWFNS
jgi:hypothetical protein